ncbi:MAG: prepilin peptidase [Planctomycetales bacterium]|nr:prepilin peptidase [Planctomycetales bacterium]
MQLFFAQPLELRMLVVFLFGLALGAKANWAIYRLAWNPREISPWGPTPATAPPRKATDRIPVLGWFGLRREHAIHGRGFWIRPLAIELAMAAGLVVLYRWEFEQQALVAPQLKELFRLAGGGPIAIAVPRVSDGLLHAVFLSQVALITLMVAASFIDIDEKIIPDEITIPGTLLGLLLATLMPQSLLPHVAVRNSPPVVGELIGAPPVADGAAIYIEPLTAAAPNAWPAMFAAAPNWSSLMLAQACWWLWVFALAPRVWRGRHGAGRAVSLLCRRVLREILRPPLAVIAWPGSVAIAAIWWWGGAAWVGLLSALIGMVIAGGMVWAVRIVGTAALQREAMGFGDVTLMMMVGTFLGWQASVIIFFIAPFAGLMVGALLLLLRRGDVIPYGPFLCLGSLVVAVRWPDFWSLNVQDVFHFGWLIAVVLLASFVLLGVMLAIWQQIKIRLFGGGELDEEDDDGLGQREHREHE